MKSVQLRQGGDTVDFFFLAMAQWQLNEKDKARAWYDRAVAWMDKNNPKDEELKRFRAEARSCWAPKNAPRTRRNRPAKNETRSFGNALMRQRRLAVHFLVRAPT